MSRDTVIVLKSVNYSEADKVLTVFGKHLGKFAIFAKSIRKITSKNRGNMQTLSTCDISFFEGKGLPVLTESQLLSTPDTDILKDRFDNVKRVLVMLNRILQENDPNQKVFEILLSVCKKNFDIESVNKFRVIFLKEMGFLQDFSVCNICGKSKGLKYMDISSFALLCENCYSKAGKSYKLKEFFTQALDIYIDRVIKEI